ncbi:MAG: phospholipase D-like domain-containing protein [Halobacteriota archaeon]|nr:phospholipase D-like domain-containing protein [Halobacteriota archaeon]
MASASVNHPIIFEFYPNTYTKNDLDEYIAICNPTNYSIEISGWAISDIEANISFPQGTFIEGEKTIYITRNALRFSEQSKKTADFVYVSDPSPDTPRMPGGTIRLSNDGDELLLFDSDGNLIDVVIYGDSEYIGQGWSGPTIGKAHEGEILQRNGVVDTDSKSDWDESRIYYLGQSRFPVERFDFHGDVRVFVSPDSSYKEVTGAIDAAKSSLDICVYEFDNLKIMEHVIDATKRGISVRVLLEGGPIGGIEDEELFIASEIVGANGSVSFMRGNETMPDRYRFIHAKYMLIDNVTTLILTENFKYTGVPIDSTFGSRGWGIAIEDADVTSYFTELFNDDWVGDDIIPAKEFDRDIPQITIQGGRYDPIFESREITGDFTVTPVIAPDTSLLNETVLGLMNSAKKSVYIEQLYVHKEWDDEPNLYLESAIDAARRGCEVKILLDSSWYNVASNTETVSYVNGIAEDEGLNLEGRLINGELDLDKVHTKGVIVDGDKTLVSSINWNKDSPTYSREVGVIVENQDVSEYFTQVFMHDWNGDGGGKDTSIFIVLALVLLIMGAGLYSIKRLMD